MRGGRKGSLDGDGKSEPVGWRLVEQETPCLLLKSSGEAMVAKEWETARRIVSQTGC